MPIFFGIVARTKDLNEKAPGYKWGLRGAGYEYHYMFNNLKHGVKFSKLSKIAYILKYNIPTDNSYQCFLKYIREQE